MTSPTFARSPRRCAGQRGITLFVVMMAIMLLTSLGAWVIYAGGIATTASGSQRASSQAQYIAEAGILGGTAYLAQPEAARDNMASADANRAAGSDDACLSVPGTAIRPFCKAVYMAEVNNKIGAPSIFDAQSMGPYAGSLEGNFFFEITDPRGAFVEGSVASTSQTGGTPYRNVTLTAYGSVRPTSANACLDAAPQNAAATMVGMRAQAIIGPVN